MTIVRRSDEAMNCPLFFTSPCPSCGRRVRASIEQLGEEIVCGHCVSAFIADSAQIGVSCSEPAQIHGRQRNSVDCSKLGGYGNNHTLLRPMVAPVPDSAALRAAGNRGDRFSLSRCS